MVHETHNSPKISTQKDPPIHIIMKLSEREKKSFLTKEPHKAILVGFSEETLQVQEEWDDIFKALKEKNCQPRNPE